MTVQKVQVAVKMSGDYCGFHEVTFKVLYDFTNNIPLGHESKEQVIELMSEGYDKSYSDCQQFDAVLVGKKYYVDFNS